MDNDAYRKIMATPRHHDSKPQEKFDKKSIRKLVDATCNAARPAARNTSAKPAKEKKVDKKSPRSIAIEPKSVERIRTKIIRRTMVSPRSKWMAARST